jgi:predicted component of type VI protein secretion system
MALKLVVESLRDEQPKTTVDKLMEGSRLTIGRTKDNDWPLPFGSISRKHCIVEYRNDTYFITDLNSLNGVHLNGRQLAAQTSHQLHDQDEIRIGGCNIRVYLNKPLSFSSVPKPKPVVSDHTEIAQINPQDLPRPDAGIPEGPTMQFGKQPGNRRGQQAEVNTNQPVADLPAPQHESAAAAAKTDSGSAGKPDSADEKPEQSETADTGTRDSDDDWSFLKEFEATDNKPGQSTDSLSELDDLLPSGSRRQTAGPANDNDLLPANKEF